MPKKRVKLKKRTKIKKTAPESRIKQKKHLSTKIKLFISILVIGGTLSYIFQHIYIYIITAAMLLATIIFPDVKFTQEKKEKIVLNQNYTTEFDRLYDLVKTQKAIKISYVTKAFKISKKEAEEWARILEEHGLIDLHYPVLSEPELR